jgi:hypothetical protein
MRMNMHAHIFSIMFVRTVVERPVYIMVAHNSAEAEV